MQKKLIISLIVLLILILIILGIIFVMDSHKVAILAYHGIMPHKLNDTGDNLIVDSEKFREELKILKKLGYKTMTLDEYDCWKEKKCKKYKKSVLITFDDGYINNYDYAFNILRENDMNATVFVVGSYTSGYGNVYMSMKMFDKIKEEYPNIDIASHSYNLHFHSDKTYDEVSDDAKKMKEIIDTKYYAYPYGDYNDDYIRALKDNDYRLAFTFGPGKEHRKSDIDDDNYRIPRLNISKDMSIFKFILRLVLPL